MDGQKDYFSQQDEHQPIIEDQNRCSLCGTHLSFKHKVDYETLSVHEEAECPSCLIKLKAKDFSLQ